MPFAFVSLSLSVCLSVCLSVTLSIPLPLSVSLSPFLFCLSVCPSLSVSGSLGVSLSLSVSVFLLSVDHPSLTLSTPPPSLPSISRCLPPSLPLPSSPPWSLRENYLPDFTLTVDNVFGDVHLAHCSRGLPVWPQTLQALCPTLHQSVSRSTSLFTCHLVLPLHFQQPTPASHAQVVRSLPMDAFFWVTWLGTADAEIVPHSALPWA